MSTATIRSMHPLPVRPIDGPRGASGAAPLPPRSTSGTMQPLPHPTWGDAAAVDASAGAALGRMLQRLGIQPLPIIDPAA